MEDQGKFVAARRAARHVIKRRGSDRWVHCRGRNRLDGGGPRRRSRAWTPVAEGASRLRECDFEIAVVRQTLRGRRSYSRLRIRVGGSGRENAASPSFPPP